MKFVNRENDVKNAAILALKSSAHPRVLPANQRLTQ